MSFFSNMKEDLFPKNDNNNVDIDDQEMYETAPQQAAKPVSSSNKIICVEPRAYSESQQIADHLKRRNSVVVNLKRVTADQAKRIIDFLSGTLYAIGGDLQKLGNGIYLCTPKNVDVEGRMSDEESDKKSKAKIEDEMDF